MASILTPSREQNALFANELRGVPLMALGLFGIQRELRMALGEMKEEESKKHHCARGERDTFTTSPFHHAFILHLSSLIREAVKRA